MDSRVERGCPNPLSQMIPPLKIPSLPHTIGHIQPWMWTFIAGHQRNIFYILLPGKKHRHALGPPTLDCTGGVEKIGVQKQIFARAWGVLARGWGRGGGGKTDHFQILLGSLHGREGSLHGGVLDPCTGAFWIPARGRFGSRHGGVFGSLHGEFLRCRGSILDLV